MQIRGIVDIATKAVQTGVLVGCFLLLPASIFAQEATTTEAAVTSLQTQNQTNNPPQAADVYQVTQLEGEQDFGDFVVGPGKFDLTIAPGESETIAITVTNRTGEEKLFTLTTEDVTGSNDPETPTVLLGDDTGPYSLRDFLSVAAERFYIQPGERVTVPVEISLPLGAEPGGRYGSMLVQTVSDDSETADNRSSAAVVSRIAVLFFIKTPGELDQSGQLVDFTTVPESYYFSSGPITFGLLYENTGTVHTNPAGEITVTNILGQQVGYLEVLPWFSLPQSLRLREVTWERDNLLGRYTAQARVYRGYGETIDEQSITFWVINWRLLAILVGSVVLLWIIVRFFTSRFTLTRKQP